jgi:APA family basic amino acid/polyamine antiporter
MILNTISSRPREAAIGIVLMLTGIPMWWWFKKRNNSATIEDEKVVV